MNFQAEKSAMDADADSIFNEAKAWLMKSRSVKPLESERIIAGLIAALSRIDRENARLRGLCGLAPKQPVPDLLG